MIYKKDEQENNEAPSDEFVFEDDEEVSNPQNAIKSLKSKLKESDALKKEYLNSLQKAKAEFTNLRKQDEIKFGEIRKFANEDIITEMLPVLDSFEMALNDKNLSSNVPKEWLKGFEGIHNQIVSLFEKNNVTKINPVGKSFDPREHEAIGVIETQRKEEDNLVLEVFQSGYKFYDKVLRTAKVKVGVFNPNE